METPACLQQCRLCRQVGILRDSHILPSWTFDRAAHGPEGRQPQLVFMDARKGTALLSNKQLTEHLLCEGCEQRFSRDEGYASSILVQESGAFPWLDAVRDQVANGRIVNAAGIDTEALVRFGCSVVWRGSVCSELKASLGPYERTFAEFLLGSAALPVEACVVVNLLEKALLHRSLVPPQSYRYGGCHVHWFLASGALVQIVVGQRVPPPLYEACLARRRVVLVSDGEDLMSVLGPSIVSSIPKGKLARPTQARAR